MKGTTWKHRKRGGVGEIIDAYTGPNGIKRVWLDLNGRHIRTTVANLRNKWEQVG